MISRGGEIARTGGGAGMVPSDLLVTVFSFFPFFSSFIFCHLAFIVLSTKKPHVARAMERTKPIYQKQVRKESYGTVKYRLAWGFSSAGRRATLIVRKVKSCNLYERKA